MNRETMVKTKWIPYMDLIYTGPRTDESVRCMLVSINFDEEIVTLQLYETDFYNQQDITVNLNHVEIPPKPKKELKIIK